MMLYVFCGNSLEKTKMKENKILSAMSAQLKLKQMLKHVIKGDIFQDSSSSMPKLHQKSSFKRLLQLLQ